MKTCEVDGCDGNGTVRREWDQKDRQVDIIWGPQRPADLNPGDKLVVTSPCVACAKRSQFAGAVKEKP